MDRARKTALNVLCQVLDEGAYSNLALKEHMDQNRLSGDERRFCVRMVHETLEHLIQIDYILSHYIHGKRIKKDVKNLLRMGACQLLLMQNVPDAAAVNESVKLLGPMGKNGLKGFVNGVLRNVARTGRHVPYPPDGSDEALSIVHSVPVWLIQYWREGYGEERMRSMIQAVNTNHWTAVRPNGLKWTQPDFEAYLDKRGWKYQRGQIAKQAYLVRGVGNAVKDEGYQDGQYSLQGESAMLVCECMAPQPGEYILDACAAPGGKSAYLAEMMRDMGRVLAWDMHEHRVALIRNTMARLEIQSVQAQRQDATQFLPQWKEKMDRVLVDAPCSGLGVLSSKPEMKYTRKREDIAALAELQKQLLKTCCQYVRPGGVLVYSTCTISPEENEAVIADFLKQHSEFVPSSWTGYLPAGIEKNRVKHGAIQLFPDLDGCDGFYMARLVRRDG